MAGRASTSERLSAIEALLHQQVQQGDTPGVVDAYGKPYAPQLPPAPTPNPISASHPYWGQNPWGGGYRPPPWGYPPPAAAPATSDLATVLAAVAPIIAKRAFENRVDPNTTLMQNMMNMFMHQNSRMMEIQMENQGPDLEGYAAIMTAMRSGGGLRGMWDGGGTPSAPDGSPKPGSKEDMLAMVKYLAENEPESLRAFAQVAAAATSASPGAAGEADTAAEPGPT